MDYIVPVPKTASYIPYGINRYLATLGQEGP
jgi:hypothetical protein